MSSKRRAPPPPPLGEMVALGGKLKQPKLTTSTTPLSSSLSLSLPSSLSSSASKAAAASTKSSLAAAAAMARKNHIIGSTSSSIAKHAITPLSALRPSTSAEASAASSLSAAASAPLSESMKLWLTRQTSTIEALSSNDPLSLPQSLIDDVIDFITTLTKSLASSESADMNGVHCLATLGKSHPDIFRHPALFTSLVKLVTSTNTKALSLALVPMVVPVLMAAYHSATRWPMELVDVAIFECYYSGKHWLDGGSNADCHTFFRIVSAAMTDTDTDAEADIGGGSGSGSATKYSHCTKQVRERVFGAVIDAINSPLKSTSNTAHQQGMIALLTLACGYRAVRYIASLMLEPWLTHTHTFKQCKFLLLRIYERVSYHLITNNRLARHWQDAVLLSVKARLSESQLVTSITAIKSEHLSQYTQYEYLDCCLVTALLSLPWTTGTDELLTDLITKFVRSSPLLLLMALDTVVRMDYNNSKVLKPMDAIIRSYTDAQSRTYVHFFLSSLPHNTATVSLRAPSMNHLLNFVRRMTIINIDFLELAHSLLTTSLSLTWPLGPPLSVPPYNTLGLASHSNESREIAIQMLETVCVMLVYNSTEEVKMCKEGDAALAQWRNRVRTYHRRAVQWVTSLPSSLSQLLSLPLNDTKISQHLTTLLFLHPSINAFISSLPIPSLSYWKLDPNSHRKQMLLLYEKLPVELAVLMLIAQLAVPDSTPVTGSARLSRMQALTLSEMIVKRALPLGTVTDDTLMVDDLVLIDTLFRMSVYAMPEAVSAKLPAPVPEFAITSLYWRVSVLVLMLASCDSSVVSAAYRRYPMVRCLIEMVVTRQYQFPPFPSPETQSLLATDRDREMQYLTLLDAINQSTSLPSPSTKRSSLIKDGTLVLFNPHQSMRPMPDAVAQSIKALDNQYQLGHRLRRLSFCSRQIQSLTLSTDVATSDWVIAGMDNDSEGFLAILPCSWQALLLVHYLKAYNLMLDTDAQSDSGRAIAQSVQQHCQSIFYYEENVDGLNDRQPTLSSQCANILASLRIELRDNESKVASLSPVLEMLASDASNDRISAQYALHLVLCDKQSLSLCRPLTQCWTSAKAFPSCVDQALPAANDIMQALYREAHPATLSACLTLIERLLSLAGNKQWLDFAHHLSAMLLTRPMILHDLSLADSGRGWSVIRGALLRAWLTSTVHPQTSVIEAVLHDYTASVQQSGGLLSASSPSLSLLTFQSFSELVTLQRPWLAGASNSAEVIAGVPRILVAAIGQFLAFSTCTSSNQDDEISQLAAVISDPSSTSVAMIDLSIAQSTVTMTAMEPMSALMMIAETLTADASLDSNDVRRRLALATRVIQSNTEWTKKVYHSNLLPLSIAIALPDSIEAMMAKMSMAEYTSEPMTVDTQPSTEITRINVNSINDIAH